MKAIRLGCQFLVIIFALTVSATTWAGSSRLQQQAVLQDIILDAGIENDLRQLLGSHYRAFEKNFVEVANPVLLKDGGIFVDGWRSGHPNEHAAAFIYYPDKRVHAAYYNKELGEVIYFGYKASSIHPAIQIWQRRFAPPVQVILKESITELTEGMTPQTNTPTAAEQVELRKVAASIWNESLAGGWDMNAAVGDILGAVTKEIIDCSAAFSLVPKPAGWVPGWGYVAKTASQIVSYVSGVSASNQYKVCVRGTALNWRSAIEMASAGI